MHFRDIGHQGPEASVRVGHSLVKFEQVIYFMVKNYNQKL